MKSLIGIGVALVTPFKSDKSIDFEALEKLVEHCISGGINYLVVLGTTAENATLSEKEKEEVKNCIIQKNNQRLPLVLGIGGNNTIKIAQEIQETNTSEFEAILSVSPYYNKPTQEGIYQHYKAIATSTDKKIILYNVPGRTASNVNAQTTLRIAQDFNNIVAIKEACPDFLQSTEIIKNKPKDFLVLSGDDEFTLPMTLAGGKGVISVIGQGIPESFSKMVNFGLNQQVSEAYNIHYNNLNLTRAIYKEGNPAGIKAVLNILGIAKPHTRLPLIEASKELTSELETELKNIL